MQSSRSAVDLGDNLQPYSSFNLTMEEEYRKIRGMSLMYKTPDVDKNGSSKEIPCDFLRFVANMRDDLE